MPPDSASTRSPRSRRVLITIAWIVTLLVSTLPTILLNEFGSGAPAWIFWAKIVFLLVLTAAATFWDTIKPLRSYFIVILVLYLAEWGLQSRLGNSLVWKNWFPSSSFSTDMLGVQILRLGVALVMVATMFGLKKRRSAFFLVKGNINAAAEPIPFIMSNPEPWTKLGRNLSLFISLGTLVFLVAAARPSLGAVWSAVPILPVVMLFAAMNAFSEEMNYKASFLAVLEDPAGKNHSLLLMAAYFGIGHYYGVPYGLIGVLMAGVLGWLLGKSMIETRGFAWAWFIHFLQDILIFSFMAVGSISAGGGS